MSKIQIKRGNNANVEALTLLSGEMAFVLDTGKLLIGNGTDKVVINKDITADDIPTLPIAKITGLGTASTKDTGVAEGNVPILDANGKIPDSVIPALAITDVTVVDSEANMLALTAQQGDIAIRSDLNASAFILINDDPTKVDNWKSISNATVSVSSVNGKTGTVVLTAADVNLGNVTNESKETMFTDSVLTGTPTAPTALADDNSTKIATTAYVKSQNYLSSNDTIDGGTF